MLPHIENRPVTMERYPAGIGNKGFWQKDVSKGFPDWLERVEVPKKDGVVHHPLVTDVRSLLWVANQNTITPHVWTSRVPDLHRPDICVFDLDPPEDGSRRCCARRRSRCAISSRSSGSPVGSRRPARRASTSSCRSTARSTRERRRGFAHAVGRLLVERYPKELTLEFNKDDRAGRILVDTGRNDYSATFAAAYAVRPRRGAPVSAPCTWDEVITGDVTPRSLTVRNLPARVHKVGDIWADMRRRRRSLAPAIERLQKLSTNIRP